MTDTPARNLVAVIGAGPAGMFAARELASNGVHVLLFNRDIKVGGLAEYGIYYAKHKMKEGLRKQFHQILDMPEIDYFGNVTIGRDAGLSLDDLRDLGVQAILVTVGAQGTKWLGLPGENLKGVFHAKDIVYHYNSLPPFSTQYFPVAKRVALIGVGNVMLDIAHWTIRELKVEEVIAVARRGPAEIKFARKELEIVAKNIDMEDLESELKRVAPIMESVGQNVQEAREFILSAMPKALEPVSNTRFRFKFLSSPTRILGDEDGHVIGLEIEDNTLVKSNGDTKARGLGTRHRINVDMVVFCIGDRVDESFGLPVTGNEFAKNPKPLYPQDGYSYESYNPRTDKPITGVFVAGWSREASSGLVGLARRDGENGARAVLEYLKTLSPLENDQPIVERIRRLLRQTGKPVIHKEDVKKLEIIEQEEAKRLGVPVYKMKTDHEMLVALGKAW